MGCCGRPDNRVNKEGAAGYYQKYAYLSSSQREAAQKVVGQITTCDSCDALTMTANNSCIVCGNPKESKD